MSMGGGTMVCRMKKGGERVVGAEPLFEISPERVDAEIPAPAAGVVTEIRHKEGETGPVNTIVAIIGQASESQAAAPLRTEGPAKAGPHEETRSQAGPREEARAQARPREEAPRSRQ